MGGGNTALRPWPDSDLWESIGPELASPRSPRHELPRGHIRCRAYIYFVDGFELLERRVRCCRSVGWWSELIEFKTPDLLKTQRKEGALGALRGGEFEAPVVGGEFPRARHQ